VNQSLSLVHQIDEPLLAQLSSLYQKQWWSQGRALDDIRDMLTHSSKVYALVEQETGRLVAFCRVMTDFVFRGMLHDVMVEDDWQGQGVGKQLMEAVTQDPDLARVQSIGLWCKPNLVPLYQKFGFEQANADYCWMQTGSLITPTHQPASP